MLAVSKTQGMNETTARPWKADLQRSARRVGTGLMAGVISGALVGGVGGRVAMFVLRLGSNPSLHGVETDDGFVIGEFTSDTGFLILLTAAAGAIGGLFYLAVRPWLMVRFRMPAVASFFAIVGGALVINPEGIDFKLLDPLWLAVVLFVTLPALYGMALHALAERIPAVAGERQGIHAWFSALAPLGAAAVLGPFGLILILVLCVGWVINREIAFSRIWTTPPVVWIGRAVLVGIGGLALVNLTGDIGAIL